MANRETARYESLMRQCIRLAKTAKARGESPVGAVVVRDGQVIEEGIEAGKARQDISRHAEVEAITAARQARGTNDLSDCILVTTHEPCILCAYVIRHHGIATVVFGAATGEIGGYSSKLAVLRDRSVQRWNEPPTVITGVLEQACRKLWERPRPLPP